MSYEGVKAYFEAAGLGDRVTVQAQASDTVEHAARAIGCRPEEIAKSMLFLVGGQPVIIVMAGDAKVNSSKFKAAFHEKPVFVPLAEVPARTGHVPGGVCPFALKEGVAVYLDESLRRFSEVHAAAGSPESTVRLSLAELEQHAAPQGWVDVAKGWQGAGA